MDHPQFLLFEILYLAEAYTQLSMPLEFTIFSLSFFPRSSDSYVFDSRGSGRFSLLSFLEGSVRLSTISIAAVSSSVAAFLSFLNHQGDFF